MKKKDIVFLSSSILLIVILWIGFNLYHAIKTSTISDILSIQTTPINPNFDTSTIMKIKSRKIVSPLYDLSTITASQTGSLISNPATPSVPVQSTQGEIHP